MTETLAITLSHISRSLQWLWFAEELKARGIGHVFIVIDEHRPLLVDDLERIGSPVYYLKHSGFLSHASNLLRTLGIMRRHRATVLHSSLPYGNLVGQIAAALLGIRRRVTTCENPSWARDHGSRKQDLIDRITYLLATRVIACTDLAREYLSRIYRVPARKLLVIPHSLKVSDYDHVDPARVAALRQRLGVSPSDFVIGMVARLERWKGHLDAIEAMKAVVTSEPRAKLLIFGSPGEARDDVSRAIRAHGLEQSVFYKGFVEDNIALYRAFDVHLHVPINAIVESFGINVIEGMISGCAQILTRSGVSSYLARHLENAWVVDYRAPAQIAEAIMALMADPGLRRRLGENAREDALRLFDYREKVERHLDAYGWGANGDRDP